MTLSSLSGCRQVPANALRIALLEGSVPAEVLKKFRQEAAEPVSFQTVGQLSSLFEQLQRSQSPQKRQSSIRRLFDWVKKPAPPQPDSLISLGDYWLTSAIAQNLIDPIQLSPAVLAKLPLSWQQFVSRGPKGQPGGESSTLWAAPYKVQFLVVVYREGKVPKTSGSQPFSSWRDLLDPALKDRIALPDHPRIVLGLLQKMQSGSFNPSLESAAEKPPTAAEIKNQLSEQLGNLYSQLDQQVKTYDASNSLKALINEDVDVAVSWSADVVAAQRRYRDLKMTIPNEGSLLSADVWVRPKGPAMSQAAQDWISYCWEPGPAAQISLTGKGFSPIFLGEEATLPKALASSAPLIESVRNSEPLLPLSPEAQTAYFEFWQQIRAKEVQTS